MNEQAVLKEYIRGVVREVLLELSSKFSFATLNKLKTPQKVLDYCEACGLVKLGEGTARTVFKLNATQVLKVAINESGMEQNKTESEIGNCTSVKDLFARIDKIAPNFLWLVMELVVPVNSDAQFSKLIKMDIAAFRNTLTYWYAENMQIARHNQFEPEQYQKNLKNRYVKAVLQVVQSCDMLPGDFAKSDSWGITTDRRLVVIDYGLSKSIFMKYYR